MQVTATQIRMARACLKLAQSEVAEMAGMEASQLSNFENGKANLRGKTLRNLVSFFELSGIEFSDSNCVRQAAITVELNGVDGFSSFMNDVYQTTVQLSASNKKNEICVSNVDEQNWIHWMSGDQGYEKHASRMKKLSKSFSFKIFVQEGDHNFIAKGFAEYRYIPKEYFNDQSFYVYGDKLALLEFGKHDVQIKVINNKNWSESFRKLFNYAWDKTPRMT